jgi:membrane-bound lytic murein transglycosylase F
MMIEKVLKKKTKAVIKNVWTAGLICLCSCTGHKQEKQETDDLPEIRSKGILIAMTDHHPADYFIFNGEPMGFQFELFAEISKHLGINVEIRIGKDDDQNMDALASGQCDMVITSFHSGIDSASTACIPLYNDRIVLLQRKPAQWRQMNPRQTEQQLVRHPETLAGKMVYTSGCMSAGEETITESGQRIAFVNFRNIEPETLFKLVNNSELDYAACRYSVARLITGRYPDIDIDTSLGELSVGWAVRSSSDSLQHEICAWLEQFKQTTRYALLYNTYYKSKTTQNRINSRMYAARTGIVSDYDELFRKYSAGINWDWRLLASLVCQESRFNPEARSRVGAFGLMQIMPSTMEELGVDSTSPPEKQIVAGVKYIKRLNDILSKSIPDKNECIKFVLAAYNIGPGHILDARRLAEKYGKDASVWDNNVDSCLLSKTDPRFYTDPEVRYGRCVGKETNAFVAQVMQRYEHYKNIVPE